MALVFYFVFSQLELFYSALHLKHYQINSRLIFTTIFPQFWAKLLTNLSYWDSQLYVFLSSLLKAVYNHILDVGGLHFVIMILCSIQISNMDDGRISYTTERCTGDNWGHRFFPIDYWLARIVNGT